MLPLGFFRRRAFTGVQLAAFAVSGSMFALFLYLTLYLQSFLGFSPIEAGLRYLPITVASFVVAPLSGMALAKIQARYLMGAGLALTGLGLLLMSGLQLDSEWTALLLGFLVSGIGVGLLNPVIADVALSVVPKEQSGMAAGINDTFRQVGIAVGIAAWGAIFLGAGAAKTQEVAGGALDERPGPRPGRGDLVGDAAAGGLGGCPAGAQDAARERRRTGLPPRPQRDPPARGAALLRRRGAGAVAGARAATSSGRRWSTPRSRSSRSRSPRGRNGYVGRGWVPLPRHHRRYGSSVTSSVRGGTPQPHSDTSPSCDDLVGCGVLFFYW